MMSSSEQLAKALRQAYNYGQTYWQQADSEYASQWKKADATAERFAQFVLDTVAAATPAAPAPSEWISVADRLPEVDEDGIAYVWAVNVGAKGFSRSADACVTRYHHTLGWQPNGSTGWDWIITHWMHFPALPDPFAGIAADFASPDMLTTKEPPCANT